MTPEGRVEDHLYRQCKKLGVLCYKFVSPSNTGVPDRIIIKNGRTIFIELKAPGKEPRKKQQYIIRKLKEENVDVRVVDNNDDVDEILKEICVEN